MCFHREITPGERYKKEMKFVQKKISQAREQNRKKWIRNQKYQNQRKKNQEKDKKWNEYPKTTKKKMSKNETKDCNGNRNKYPRTEVRIRCDDITIHVIKSLTTEGYEIYFDWNREKYIIMV